MKRWDKYKPILLRIKVLYDSYSEYSKECRNNLILGYDYKRTRYDSDQNSQHLRAITI